MCGDEELDKHNIKTIYYANFDEDSSTSKEHTLWLNVLLLLSEKILIPPTHLLRMRFENLNILKNYAVYISNGAIHTNLYEEFESVTQYLKYKIDETLESKAISNLRLETIADLFSSSNSYQITKACQQSDIFMKIIDDGLRNLNQKRSLQPDEFKLIENAQNNLLERSSRGYIYRSEIETEIHNLHLNEKIKRHSLEEVLKVIDEAYYIAGAYHNNAIITYSKQRNNNFYIPKTYANKTVNALYYDPNVFLTVMQSLGIISSFNDFNRIEQSELNDLRNTKVFSDFILKYKSFCESINSYNLSDLEEMTFVDKSKKKIRQTEKAASIIYGLNLLPIDLLLGMLETGFFPIPILTAIKLVLDKVFENTKPAKYIQKNVPDKICKNMLEIIDPFSAFCYKLKKDIEYRR